MQAPQDHAPPPLEIMLAFASRFPSGRLAALPGRRIQVDPGRRVLSQQDQAICDLVLAHAAEIWALCTLPPALLQAALQERHQLLAAAAARARAVGGNGAGDHGISPQSPATQPDPTS